MRRKSDIFGSNPFPKFYRDTDRAFGTSTRSKSRRSNNTDWSNPIRSYRNNRHTDSRVDVVHHNTVDVVHHNTVDVVHHDPYEDYLEGQRNEKVIRFIFKAVFIIVGLFIALTAVLVVLSLIWYLIVYIIIPFIVSIKYYIILAISLIVFAMVTIYLDRKDIASPYSFLGGIIVSAILTFAFMTVFGLI